MKFIEIFPNKEFWKVVAIIILCVLIGIWLLANHIGNKIARKHRKWKL